MQSETFWDIPKLAEPDQLLIDAYARAGRTLDDLPYTREFETVVSEVGAAFANSHVRVFRRLHNLRKAGRLPRSAMRGVSPAVVKPEEERLLEELIRRQVTSLGQRDQLPYTDGFDTIVSEFNQQTGRSLPPHDVWRLVARLAK